ncbi:MAG: Der1-like family-domain-containing protein [Linnemannia elongata]|nr:MAG: Der1-like family-domain-containing protein [Linnemannia elongata]
MAIPIETWYYDVPIVTRLFATGAALVALAVQTGFTNAFQLYFNYQLVIYQHQYWRPITTFLYFGPLGLDFVFHMFFLVRYSRMLEEGSFYGRTMDYAWMLFLSAFSLLCLSPFVAMPFLGSPLAFTLVYIWSRRNPSIPLNFLGLFVFTAPYLPWVLLGFTLLLNSHFPTGDLMGIAVGHIYYFFEDVWPKEQASGGRRYLQTPSFLTRPRGVNISAELQDEALPEQANVEPESEQSGTTAPTTTLPNASGSPSSAAGAGSGTSATTTALENGPRVEARSRPNASAHNQVDPLS